MTRFRAICTAVVLVCASGQVLADTASHNASAEAFLTLAHADKLGTPVSVSYTHLTLPTTPYV